LFVGPTVASQAAGAGPGAPFDRHQPAAGSEDSPSLSKARVKVGPVVHGCDGPNHRRGRVGQREPLGSAFGESHPLGGPGKDAGNSQHHRRRIHTYNRRPEPRRTADRGARPTADVHDRVARLQFAQPFCETGVALSPDRHAGRREEPAQPGEARVVGMVVRNGGLLCGHTRKVDS
jgi:hypothetical protein